MQISDIKPSRQTGRHSVFVDGHYAFSLDELELSSSGLRIGATLSQPELDTWKTGTQQSKAKAQAFRYLALRPRSVEQLREYLRRQGYEEAIIAATVEDLLSRGYLDDLAFATSWVEYRQASTPRSRIQLVGELRAKGVAASVIDQVLSEQGQGSQRSAVQAVIMKKRHLYRDERKLIAYCVRQGFPYSLVRSVLQELDPESSGD